MATVTKALAHKTRRQILLYLKENPVDVTAGELSKKLGQSPQAMSAHFKILKDAKLIVETPNDNDGRSIEYNLSLGVLEDGLLTLVEAFGDKPFVRGRLKIRGPLQKVPARRKAKG